MKPDAWCIIAVRFTGFLLLVWSSIGMTDGLRAVVGTGSPFSGGMLGGGGQSIEALMVGLVIGTVSPLMQTLLGLYLFFGGKWVVRRLLKGVNWPGRSTCHKCGYELAGIEGGRCPECGVKRGDVA
jgi:hypothetical protein